LEGSGAGLVIDSRILPDGRLAAVFSITFGRARLGVGPTTVPVWDDVW
jgi:hypothetical protein